MRALLTILLMVLGSLSAKAEPLPREKIETYIRAPFSLGEELNEDGVYSLLNSGGIEAGYVFESEPLAPMPGFSGAPINLLVVLDLEGRFMDVQLIEHNEPIFVSGLGEAPFHKFFEQYGGLSISDSIVVGTPYGDAATGSQLVYLDGVTKATASVRIAHESVMGAALAVAREKMQGLATVPPAYPNTEYEEALTWQNLVDQGIATNKVIANAEVDALFEGTLWEDDDPEAKDYPDGLYLNLWIVDLGPKSIARSALSEDSYEELQSFMEISDNDEPILLIETARHGLVSEGFVRNTAPDWISAEQDGLPVALRDADLFVELNDGLPDGTAMILRTDRRLGFDPSRQWVLKVLAVREHGMFQPETGSVTLEVPHITPERFFVHPVQIKPAPPWLEALRNRRTDMIILGVFLGGIVTALSFRMKSFAAHRWFTPLRLGILAILVGFVGWWGQGQLSIVTVLGTVRAAIDRGSFAFLLYDPFSLLIWAVSIVGFVAWGRGLYCGWLCPFGGLQEFTHHVGKALGLPQIEPSHKWDRRLKCLKYIMLAGLVVVAFVAPDQIDKAAEIEPFKTAITTFFIREWFYVAYAVFWLLLGMVLFKGFCRYLCPLGAFMAIGGLFRGRDWIERRAECGSPCQLCKVKCKYGAIKKTGQIQYDECFQCLDCVAIHDDEQRCVPLIVAARRQTREVAAQ
ncbi:4Fe-4S binding protein [Ruegeria hyattellae]|uniref:4Fe-4S binding protein n=1 Tax=Ruegeria hyattellae TaxID=3233337 RepID=UPI00355BBD35